MSNHRIADAVVVAAGSSQRMGGMDKLSAPIAGMPMLWWAVRALAAAPEVADITIVTSTTRAESVRSSPWLRRFPARVVVGGERRQDSVAAGVRASSAEVVLVHDAARPLVSASLISRVVAGVLGHGAAIPVLPVVDALKQVTDDRVAAALDRVGLVRAQTPQGARRDVLLHAVDAHAAGDDEIPDEAELLTRDGVAVHTVEGEATNIKVTLPEDLALARRLAGGTAGGRSALGSDSHPFGPDEGLRLGGLLFEAVPRLHGHSDGDVVLHAICDGLLAAADQGDLGRLFPSGDPGTRGIDSRSMLAHVLARLEERDMAPDSVDVTILAARPRLESRRLDAMAASIAALTGVAPWRVTVKAATGNLSADEGAGRTISATCLVSVAAR